jgi:hypothetical protein
LAIISTTPFLIFIIVVIFIFVGTTNPAVPRSVGHRDPCGTGDSQALVVPDTVTR